MVLDHAEIDPVLNALGPCGLFPLVQLCFFYLGYFPDAMQLFGYVFTAQDVGYRCASAPNNSDVFLPDLQIFLSNATSVQYGQCAITVVNNVTETEAITKEYSCLFEMEYDKPRDMSIVSEFDLVCDRAGLAELTQTIMSLGVGISGFVFPPLSDRYGRKRVTVVSHIVTVGVGVVAGLAPNYIVFVVAKFVIGACLVGVGLTAVTAAAELFPSSHRSVASAFVSTLLWVICIASLAPLAYLLRFESWRTLQLSFVGFSLLVVFMIVVLSEPLRWLVANNKTKEAERVIRRAARWNRKDSKAILEVFHGLHNLHSTNTSHTDEAAEEVDPLSPRVPSTQMSGGHSRAEWVKEGVSFDVNHTDNSESRNNTGEHPEKMNGLQIETVPQYTADGAENETKNEKEKLETRAESSNGGDSIETKLAKKRLESSLATQVHLKHLATNSLLRKNLLINIFLWFVNCLTYNSLYLMSSTLATSIYISFFLNAAVEGASCIFMVPLLERLGRKKTVGGFHFVAGVGLIASSVCFSFEDSARLKIAGTVFSLIGKLGIGGSSNIIYMYTPEMFPTNVRNAALGISAAVSTFGTMIAPFSNVLADYAIWAPGAIFGTCSMLAVILLVFLPETKGRELPQSVGDLEQWYPLKCGAEKSEVV